MRRLLLLFLVTLLGCSNGESTKPDGSAGDLPTGQDSTIDAPAQDAPVVDLPPSPDTAPPADLSATDGGNNSCAGATKLTWSGSTVTVALDTTSATDTMDLGVSGCTGDVTIGPDLFYSIQLPAGAYDVELSTSLDMALYVLGSCSPTACVAGSDNVGSGVPEKVTLTPSSATTYIIVVDSYDPSEAGAATLTVKVAGVPDGGVPDGGPASQVVITELMANPAVVSDNNGEWIELYNAGSAPVDLSGWTLKDDGTDSHTIAGPLTIGAGQFVVLGSNAQSSANGGVTVAYQYSSFFLSNSADEVVLVNPGGSEVDRVAWTSSWGIAAGASHQLLSPALNNNLAASWCVSTTAWSGSAGDLGTPGAANNCPVPDGGVPDAGVPDAGIFDGPTPDAGTVPYCPPPGTTFNNPPTNLGDLNGQACGYACWGSGTLYNQCGASSWQFCLPQGVFAPCQPKP